MKKKLIVTTISLLLLPASALLAMSEKPIDLDDITLTFDDSIPSPSISCKDEDGSLIPHEECEKWVQSIIHHTFQEYNAEMISKLVNSFNQFMVLKYHRWIHDGTILWFYKSEIAQLLKIFIKQVPITNLSDQPRDD